MLPANLAKGRTAARGLGELVMVGGPGGSGLLQTLRYSPYSVPPSTNTATMVALSQPMSFTSPAPPISAGSSALATPSGLPGFQLYGLDSANQMASINQLLANQLGLKTGFSLTGFETGLDHFQAGFSPMPAGCNMNTVQVGI